MRRSVAGGTFARDRQVERIPITLALPEVWTRAGISTSVCSKCAVDRRTALARQLVPAESWWQMACTLHVAWDERLTDYHFGPGHPMAPVRVELTMRLAHEFGLWERPGRDHGRPGPGHRRGADARA